MRNETPWWRTRGEWWVLAQTVLMIATAVVPRVAPPWRVTGYQWLPALGLVLGLAGLALAAVSAYTLGGSLTILPRPRADARFVQVGVYRFVRHPIYSGIILAALGWALWRTGLLHLALATSLGFSSMRKRVRRNGG